MKIKATKKQINEVLQKKKNDKEMALLAVKYEKYNKKEIMQKAWVISRERNIGIGQAIRLSWEEARIAKEEFILLNKDYQKNEYYMYTSDSLESILNTNIANHIEILCNEQQKVMDGINGTNNRILNIIKEQFKAGKIIKHIIALIKNEMANKSNSRIKRFINELNNSGYITITRTYKNGDYNIKNLVLDTVQ